VEQEPIGKLTTKEKLGFIGLVILTVGVIYLGFNQVKNSINSPSAIFALKYTAVNSNTDNSQEKTNEELKKKDTDRDGLNDYEELYIYHSSPYLSDSDSDGSLDKEEVDSEGDPNCPKGQTCGGIREISNPTAAGYATTTVELPPSFVPSSDQVLLQSMFGNQPEPKALRDFLIKQGMDKKSLDSFSDEELINYYKEIISKPIEKSVVNNQVGTTISVDGNLLDANGVRALLIKQGMNEAELSKIDDAILLQAAAQLLKK